MPNINQKLIAFEGIEGVGKSTHIHYVAELLRDQNQSVLLTREPGGTPLAERIRNLLLAESTEKIQPETELLLLYAARSQHVTNLIKPALRAGQWVLCDRFIAATFAYQGGGRKIAQERIESLNHWLLGNFAPAHTFLFDADPEVGFARIQQRALDRIEQEDLDFFRSVRARYLQNAQNDPQRIQVINADRDLLSIQQDLKVAIDKMLEREV